VTIRRVVVDNSAPVWAKQLETDLNGALSGIGSDLDTPAAAGTFKGNNAGAAAKPKDLTPTQAAALLGFAQSIGTNGYVKLPGGLILQWGTKPAGTADVIITFPLPFPTACLAVVGTSSFAVSTSAMVVVHCVLPTQTDFRWYGRADTGAGPAAETTGGSWIAIGY
jgi:hypothetical protein